MSRMNKPQDNMVEDHTYISMSGDVDATELNNTSTKYEWVQPCIAYGGFFAVCVAIILLAYFFW
jgi:hypothetical protein